MSNSEGITLMFLLFIAGAILGNEVAVRDYQQQAIEHHAAQYNATDGSFEWLK